MRRWRGCRRSWGARTGLHFETLAGVAVGFMAEQDPAGGVADVASAELRGG